MLTQSVDVKNFDTLSTSGEPSFTTTSGVSARVERNIEISGEDFGADSDITTIVWLEQEIGEGDKIVLPSGDEMEVQDTMSIPSVDGRTTLYKAAG